MVRFSSRLIAQLVLLCGLFSAFAWSGSLPPVVANQNHAPAGTLRNGILTIKLQVAAGEWHPEAEDGMALSVYTFAEVGHPLQNPGPLIRVPQGTLVHASVHNTLSVPISVHGLADKGADNAVLRLAPGAVQSIEFKASTPGLYFYWGASEVERVDLRYGIDSELTGALVVDPPGYSLKDEIFVMEMISEFAGPGAQRTLATINGKSWPYTQNLRYDLGQTVHWRWINATNEPHAMHLHGFYYRIEAFNRAGRLETYSGDARPNVVTQRIAPGETFDMSWSPDRAGKWLFHCHMLKHMMPPIVPEVPGLTITSASAQSDGHRSMHEHSGMGQLVLGITVPAATASPTPEWQPRQKLQLEISERIGSPRYRLQVLGGAPKVVASHKPDLIGPPIVLVRGEPVEIEVVNKLTQPTAIHWHGIEIDSYYDGVPDWSGSDAQATPPIPPGKSFIARMTPPRAGTFIYHTHWHDVAQLTNGLYGPLIVTPPGETFDAASDLVFVFSIGDFGTLGDLALINGTPQSKMMRLQAGKKYRLRFINISTNNQGMQVSLHGANGPAEWTVVAKDGADLPKEQLHPAKAQLTITVGETCDVEFLAQTAQDLLLDLLLPAQKVHTTQTLSFTPVMATSNRN